MNTTSPFVHKDDIVLGLHRLGLRKDDAVGVHGSLSRLGHVVGGAASVIEALIETVGPAGTIVMPTYSDNVVYTEPTPEEQALGITWKGRIGPFDPATNELLEGNHIRMITYVLGGGVGAIAWGAMLGHTRLSTSGAGLSSPVHSAVRRTAAPTPPLKKKCGGAVGPSAPLHQ